MPPLKREGKDGIRARAPYSAASQDPVLPSDSNRRAPHRGIGQPLLPPIRSTTAGEVLLGTFAEHGRLIGARLSMPARRIRLRIG